MARDAIRDKVSIVGVGCCQFGENWDQSPADMIVDAAYEAYADAGIEKPQEQIDAVFTGSIYSNKGPHECSDALKLWKPVTSVSNYCATGTDAFRCGVMSIACGLYDTVLVVGYDKPKDRGVAGPSVVMTQVRDLPQTPAGWFSICASRYFEKYGAGRDDLARIAIKNHHNGTLAPNSFLKREITLEDYKKARLISWPFGLYDCAAQTDGAAAVILTRSDLAKSFRRDPVVVKGVTVFAGPNPQKDPTMDFLAWKPSIEAGQVAYEMAGVGPEDIDVAQVHDCFSLTELLTYEDLGFCEKGAAKEHIQDGRFEIGGGLPVNTDGGLKSFGHPTGATGVRMIYENTLQLQGRAGERQTPDAEIALSHNIGGYPTACGIAILGRA
ncbi:MAG: acetyl-CoA acetyltransferase [Deltaproteobacteria bacterium]|nr:acetyl-CoA acetyltransferase [Deltaproteobacteria bacterium]MBW2359441.1 acetyl-CoA acetyltransferase [Deltaproteobacteria bacterium]